MNRSPVFLITLFFLCHASMAQIPPGDSPYAGDGPYTVLSDSDMVASPAMYTYRPNAAPTEQFPVFFFQLGANGFGSSAIDVHTYDLFLKHLASFGYVVVIVNSSAAGFPNGNVYSDTYDWFQDRLNDPQHWMAGVADAGKVYIGGHSLGGVHASAFLVDRSDEIAGIVYFASFPSQGDPLFGLLGHDVSGYDGHVLSLAGSEDEDSTPAECREGYDSYTAAQCRYWVLVDGLGHGGFGNYENPDQPVGSIGRADATATIRHSLVSFLEWSAKDVTSAELDLKDAALKPNTEAEFETNCSNIITSSREVPDNEMQLFPNPASGQLRVVGAGGGAGYSVMAADGRMILQGTFGTDGMVDVSRLRSGLYYLRTTREEQVSVQCFMKR